MSSALPASLMRQTVRAESLQKYPIASCHHDYVRWRSRPPHGGGRSRTHTAPTCGNVRGGGAARVVWLRGALRPLALGRHAAVCGGSPIRTPYPPAPQAPLPLPAPRGALHRRPCRRRGGGTAAHPWASAPLSRCLPELSAHILTTPPSRGGRPLPPGPTSSPFTPAPDGRCRNTAASRNGHAPPRDRPTSRLPKSAHQLMVYEAAPQPSWPSLAANSGGRLSTCQLAPPPARALARTLRHAGRSALVTTAAMAGGARGSAGSQCGCGHMTSGDRTSRRSAHRHGRRRSASARASLREQTQDKTGTDGIGTDPLGRGRTGIHCTLIGSQSRSQPADSSMALLHFPHHYSCSLTTFRTFRPWFIYWNQTQRPRGRKTATTATATKTHRHHHPPRHPRKSEDGAKPVTQHHFDANQQSPGPATSTTSHHIPPSRPHRNAQLISPPVAPRTEKPSPVDHKK